MDRTPQIVSEDWGDVAVALLDIDPEPECDALASYRDHVARVEREEREAES